MKKICTSLLLIVALAGCGTRRGVIPDGYIFRIAHSTSGPAPASGDLAIYADGLAVYHAPTGRLKKFRISKQSLAELQKLMANDELRRDLSILTVQSNSYHDYELWWFAFDGRETKFVCRETTPSPTVYALINAARRAVKYQVRDSWFMSPDCEKDAASSRRGTGSRT